ncbi:MAG: fasciclin domain-containing protein [Gammaproteobacteria bacterium]|nr:fasciclin domain-containing protein [Gammaproteobacteria bacterium]
MNRFLVTAATVTALAFTPLIAEAKSPFKACKRVDAVQFDGTIVEAALATDALSTLADLVIAANLVEALNAPGDLTVFAPTNDAFAAIPEPVLNAIGSDVDVLTAVLTYHVVAADDAPRKYRRSNEVEALSGQSLFISNDRSGGARVNQSNIACQAVETTNGTVW